MDKLKVTLSVSRTPFLTLVLNYTGHVTATGRDLYSVTYYRDPILSASSMARRGVLEKQIAYNTDKGYIDLLIKGFKAYATELPYDSVPFPDADYNFNTNLLLMVISPANAIAVERTPTVTAGGKRRYILHSSRRPKEGSDEKVGYTFNKNILMDESVNYPYLVIEMLKRYNKQFKFDTKLTY